MEAGTFYPIITGSNQFGEANRSFTIDVSAGVPSLNSLPASNIGSSSALLHAEIFDLGGEDANLSFAYGLSSENLDSFSTPVSVSQTGNNSFLLPELESNKTYFYQALLINSASSVHGSDIFSFTTLINEVSPVVKVKNSSDISEAGATIHYELISYDRDVPVLTLYWGPVDQGELSDYGNQVTRLVKSAKLEMAVLPYLAEILARPYITE